MVPDTTIVRDLNPTARIFGIEFNDLLFILALFIPVCFAIKLFFPPILLNFDVTHWLGGKPSPIPPTLDLVPWGPGGLLWLFISAVYLQVRQGKPRGFLKDVYREIQDALEAISYNPHYWEGGSPDLEADCYWYDDTQP
ncbi:hypothetical protein [Candidatus Cyanaurora vandensis]|uniref:hypothetical protein n=1 Tax=Candidatus Cyanaurora vandensis TaxID=2714958 RepID=UPI002579F9CE|nr:hypothetical protein [Candidatus Cyanaurora vandensis]